MQYDTETVREKALKLNGKLYMELSEEENKLLAYIQNNSRKLKVCVSLKYDPMWSADFNDMFMTGQVTLEDFAEFRDDHRTVSVVFY